MIDYRLNKLCYDLQTTPALAVAYRADRQSILPRYALLPEVLAAIAAEDVGFLAKRINPFLLRYYFFLTGMSDAVFMAHLRGMGREAFHG
ncbi:MAG: hypothetical protein V4724_17200 [Pseudomonadota bacterium]